GEQWLAYKCFRPVGACRAVRKNRLDPCTLRHWWVHFEGRPKILSPHRHTSRWRRRDSPDTRGPPAIEHLVDSLHGRRHGSAATIETLCKRGTFASTLRRVRRRPGRSSCRAPKFAGKPEWRCRDFGHDHNFEGSLCLGGSNHKRRRLECRGLRE